MDNIKYKTDNAILALLLQQQELEEVKQEVGLVSNGDEYETHAGKFFTTDDLITLRDKATIGLGSTKFTGLVAKKYDGLNDGQLVFDADGYARVGDEDSLQMIATRENAPTNKGIAYYDETTRSFKTKAESSLSVAQAVNANKLASVAATNYARTDTSETFNEPVTFKKNIVGKGVAEFYSPETGKTDRRLTLNNNTADQTSIYNYAEETADMKALLLGHSNPVNGLLLDSSNTNMYWKNRTVWDSGNSNLSNVDWTVKDLRAHGNLIVNENAIFDKLIQLNNDQSIQGKINGQPYYGNMLAMGTDNYAEVANSSNTEGVKLYSKGNQLKLTVNGTGSKTHGNHTVTGEVIIDTTRLANGVLSLNSNDWLRHTAGANEGWEIVTDGAKDIEILRGIGIINHRDTALKGTIGTAPYISGIGGKGTWRISQDANAEFDNLDIREGLTCNTFTNNKINISNGDLIVSDTDTIEYVDGNILYFSKEQPFRVGDILRCQGSSTPGNIKSYYITVASEGTSQSRTDEEGVLMKFITFTDKTGSGTIETDDILLRWNSSDTDRKGLLYMSSSSTYAPFYDVIYDGQTKARYGRLDGITTSTGRVLSGYGLWAQNGYFEGWLNAKEGLIGGISLSESRLSTSAYFLDKDGTASFANGAAVFNADGRVVFGNHVSLDWSQVSNTENIASKSYATEEARLARLEAEANAAEDAQTKATTALNAAKLDATNKANKAEADAITAANTKAEAETVKAKAYADGIVTEAEQRAIDDATTKANNAEAAAISSAEVDATAKANAAEAAAISSAATDAAAKANNAKNSAISTAALDAKAKADKALADAKADAAIKANKAEADAITAASAKAEAETVKAKAYADGIVTEAEQRAIDDATTKANNAEATAISSAQADATAKANAAEAAAISSAATDAATKATNAKNSAISTAALDAKTKADKALADAKLHTGGLIGSKLTKIGATGIYTGILSADQILATGIKVGGSGIQLASDAVIEWGNLSSTTQANLKGDKGDTGNKGTAGASWGDPIGNIQKGGVFTSQGFLLNHYPTPSDSNVGEIYVYGGNFNYQGIDYTIPSGVMMTGCEGGAHLGKKYIVFIGSDKTRFTWSGGYPYQQNFEVCKYENDNWYAMPDNSTWQIFTPNVNDSIVAEVEVTADSFENLKYYMTLKGSDGIDGRNPTNAEIQSTIISGAAVITPTLITNMVGTNKLTADNIDVGSLHVGTGGIRLDSSAVISWDNLSATSKANLKGDKGNTGATGSQGIQGVKGNTGSKGDNGKDYNHYKGDWNISSDGVGYDFEFAPIPNGMNLAELKIYQNDLEGSIRVRCNGNIVTNAIGGTDNVTEWKSYSLNLSHLNTSATNIIRIEHISGASADWGHIYEVVLNYSKKGDQGPQGPKGDSPTSTEIKNTIISNAAVITPTIKANFVGTNRLTASNIVFDNATGTNVNLTGKITATSGKIAGWSFDDTKLWKTGTSTYLNHSETGTLKLDSSAVQISARNSSSRGVSMSTLGLLSNNAATQCVASSTGLDWKASIAALGFGNKAQGSYAKNRNMICGIYATVSNSNTSPCQSFAGYFGAQTYHQMLMGGGKVGTGSSLGWSTSSASSSRTVLDPYGNPKHRYNSFYVSESSGSTLYIQLPIVNLHSKPPIPDGTILRIGTRGRDIKIYGASAAPIIYENDTISSSDVFTINDQNEWIEFIKMDYYWVVIKYHNM